MLTSEHTYKMLGELAHLHKVLSKGTSTSHTAAINAVPMPLLCHENFSTISKAVYTAEVVDVLCNTKFPT